MRPPDITTAPAVLGRTSGFTLIEVLVSVAFIGITLIVFEALITSLRMNRDSRVTLTVNQAVNSYLEMVYADWQSALQYRNGTLAAPTSLPGHTWHLAVATVNPDTGVTSNQTAYDEGSTPDAYAGDVPLKRVTLRYTSVAGGGYAASVELARP